MLSGRPADRLREQEVNGHLENKLQKLEEMLESTKRISRNPFGVHEVEAQAFRDQTSQLVTELEGIDRSLKHLDFRPDAPTRLCADLKQRIIETVQHLAKENSNLMASIKAQQEVLGKKIAHIKKNKDLLKTYYPQGMQTTPSGVDSTI